MKRQVDKLDILVEVNKDTSNKLAILIEDKTHTDHHSGQLGRYYDNATKDYTPEQIIPIYFKTGYQSRFDVGVDKTYLREDFLERLRSGRKSVKNAIYHDFLAHLENMENVVQQFSMKIPTDWQDNDWWGFFMNLYKSRNQFYDVIESDGANWNYIANPSGGFFGFWWYFRPKQKDAYTPYLQLENHELCFKIAVEDNQNRSEAREEAYWHLIKTNEQFGLPVERPKRMGNGKFMTVLRWKGDYREPKDGRKLDMTATLENLKKAQILLDATFGV